MKKDCNAILQKKSLDSKWSFYTAVFQELLKTTLVTTSWSTIRLIMPTDNIVIFPNFLYVWQAQPFSFSTVMYKKQNKIDFLTLIHINRSKNALRNQINRWELPIVAVNYSKQSYWRTIQILHYSNDISLPQIHCPTPITLPYPNVHCPRRSLPITLPQWMEKGNRMIATELVAWNAENYLLKRLKLNP